MSDETWKPVPGYEGLYEVSNHGRVRSLDRHVAYKSTGGTMLRKGKILACSLHHSGYRHLTLCKGGKQRIINVCTLVASVFVPNPDPTRFRDVHHKDFSKTNDRADNLEWTTHRGNIDHSVRDHRYAKKLTPELVREIRQRATNGETQASISRALGIRYETVHMVVNRNSWRHIE